MVEKCEASAHDVGKPTDDDFQCASVGLVIRFDILTAFPRVHQSGCRIFLFYAHPAPATNILGHI